MTKPLFVTFTGLDEKTDIAKVLWLSDAYPVEWGILFSPSRQGTQPRYPNLALMQQFLDQGRAAAHFADRESTSSNLRTGMNLAAHLCGDYARQIMEDRFDIKSLPLDAFRRIQVNHTKPDPEKIAAVSGEHEMIAQWRNPEHFEDAACSWLYDPSGGRGIDAPAWPVNNTTKKVGYAGGIGPDNVAEVVSSIDSPAGYWIDMESKIRTDDWLDLSKCEAVLRQVFGNL